MNTTGSRQDSDINTKNGQTESVQEDSGQMTVLKVRDTSEILYCNGDCAMNLEKGSFFIVPTKFGQDLAEVLGPATQCTTCRSEGDPPDIVEPTRQASEQDLIDYERNIERSKEAFSITQDLIDQHGLNMKLVKVHFVLKESRIVFFFTSEKRVDFRGLVRDLVSHFRARIELRQIGVRDEARMIGGRAVCGRSLCCSSISSDLEPVSIKMAKTQRLSLNSQKISGPCGRLLCCLSFEYQAYQHEQRGFPREGQWVTTEGKRMKIVEINVLSRKVYAVNPEIGRREFPVSRLRFDSSAGNWAEVPVRNEINHPVG